MEYGIAMPPAADAWRTIKRAENLGFTYAWLYDTQMLCADVFVALAAAAMHTSRIRLCTGILIPSNRIVPVAANALASLNKLAPGRIVCGLGTGFTGRRTMGLGPIKLAQVREYVRIIRELLQDEMVEWEFEGATHKIRFMSTDLGLTNIEDPIPIHVSAFGPNARALACEIGDGWINANAHFDDSLVQAQEMVANLRDAGRDPTQFYISNFVQGRVLDEGEAYDSPRAKAQAGPMAILAAHALVEREGGFKVPPQLETLVSEYRKLYETYEPTDARYLTLHRGHLMFLRPEEERFVTADLIRNASFTGTVPELSERLRAMDAAGYQQCTFQIMPGHEEVIDDWVRVIERV